MDMGMPNMHRIMSPEIILTVTLSFWSAVRGVGRRSLSFCWFPLLTPLSISFLLLSEAFSYLRYVPLEYSSWVRFCMYLSVAYFQCYVSNLSQGTHRINIIFETNIYCDVVLPSWVFRSAYVFYRANVWCQSILQHSNSLGLVFMSQVRDGEFEVIFDIRFDFDRKINLMSFMLPPLAPAPTTFFLVGSAPPVRRMSLASMLVLAGWTIALLISTHLLYNGLIANKYELEAVELFLSPYLLLLNSNACQNWKIRTKQPQKPIHDHRTHTVTLDCKGAAQNRRAYPEERWSRNSTICDKIDRCQGEPNEKGM